KINFFNFDDIDMNAFACQMVQRFTQCFNFRTAFTDNHAWFSSMNRNVDAVSCTFDFDRGNSCILQTIFKVFSNFDIFMEQVCIIFFGIASGFPIADYADALASWTNFLAHLLSLLLFLYNDCNMACAFVDSTCTSSCTWAKT